MFDRSSDEDEEETPVVFIAPRRTSGASGLPTGAATNVLTTPAITSTLPLSIPAFSSAPFTPTNIPSAPTSVPFTPFASTNTHLPVTSVRLPPNAIPVLPVATSVPITVASTSVQPIPTLPTVTDTPTVPNPVFDSERLSLLRLL